MSVQKYKARQTKSAVSTNLDDQITLLDFVTDECWRAWHTILHDASILPVTEKQAKLRNASTQLGVA